jgi:hypothetical protein
MNPTSLAGSPIPSHGVRSASQMQADEVCGRLLLMTVNRTGVRPQRLGAVEHSGFAASALTT